MDAQSVFGHGLWLEHSPTVLDITAPGEMYLACTSKGLHLVPRMKELQKLTEYDYAEIVKGRRSEQELPPAAIVTRTASQLGSLPSAAIPTRPPLEERSPHGSPRAHLPAEHSEVVSVMRSASNPSKALLVLLHHGHGLLAPVHPLLLDVNGKHVMRVLNHLEGVRIEVEPGDVVIDSHHTTAFMQPIMEKKTTRTLHVEAGKTYYLNAKAWSGLLFVHYKMVDCEPKEAEGCTIQTVTLE